MRRLLLVAPLWLACAAAMAGDAGPGAMAGAGAPDIAALIHAQRWTDASQAASRFADPVVAKLVAYAQALTPGAASLAQIEAFEAENPGWPQPAALAERRDAALAIEPDDAVAAKACEAQPPRSVAGLARCAAAYQGQSPPNPEAAVFARAAWVAAPPDPVWEAVFLQQWAGVIGPAEQWARYDRLAWTDPAAAAQIVQRLAAPDRPRAEARLALHRDDPQAAALLARVPAPLRDPGLFLEQAKWLRRSGRDADAVALWRASGTAAERAAPDAHRTAFWNERNLLARRRLRENDAAGAYGLAADAAQTAPEAVADAAFLAGWIALRRLDDPARAAAHFAALSLVSTAAVTQARAHYWLARAEAAQGEAGAARREALVAAAYPTTFYGQLAALAAGDDAAGLARRIATCAEPGWTPAQAKSFVARDLVRAAITLAGWGEPGRAAGFLLRLAESDNASELAMTARLTTLFGLPQTGVAVARRAGRAGIVLPDAGWPIGPNLPEDGAVESRPVEAALTLAVIRQESSFDPSAISPVGARGLMQLMPVQAAIEARLLDLPVSTAALTADPGYNVQLGSDTLHRLLARFGGSLPLAVAAYNAGPLRVDEWLAQNGDPRGGDPLAMIDWIELIPFGETRNYVQRVIESVAVYRARRGEVRPYPVPWQPLPA